MSISNSMRWDTYFFIRSKTTIISVLHSAHTYPNGDRYADCSLICCINFRIIQLSVPAAAPLGAFVRVALYLFDFINRFVSRISFCRSSIRSFSCSCVGSMSLMRTLLYVATPIGVLMPRNDH